MRVHPNDQLLLEALGPVGESAGRIRQHLAHCSKCRERLSGLTFSDLAHGQPAKLEAYEPVLDRCFRDLRLHEAALRNERFEAPSLLARFLGLPQGRQQVLLQNSPRFRTWGFFALLIRTGEEETFRDPKHAEDILRLAIEVSLYLDASYGSELIEDMRARAWGYIANARRARMDLLASGAAFGEAFEHLRRGTEDPMERAVLFSLEASLRRVERRFEDAIRLAQRAIRVFRKAGESHRVGKTLVTLSTTYTYRGDPAAAISLLQQASPLIDRERDPRLALCAMHNLADNLATTGRFMEAQRALSRARPLYRQFSEPLVQGPRLWVEGKIAEGLGRPEEAVALLSAAHSCFLATNSDFEANMVSRQLSSLCITVRKSSL
jgi:tetratricopeptide (TPR) repeat protein